MNDLDIFKESIVKRFNDNGDNTHYDQIINNFSNNKKVKILNINI